MSGKCEAFNCPLSSALELEDVNEPLGRGSVEIANVVSGNPTAQALLAKGS